MIELYLKPPTGYRLIDTAGMSPEERRPPDAWTGTGAGSSNHGTRPADDLRAEAREAA